MNRAGPGSCKKRINVVPIRGCIMKKALLFESAGNTVTCLLCAHRCNLKPGNIGLCGVRKNIDGQLFSLNADRVAATHADPIEKKPLYHFLPGSTSFSVAAMGCNFKCAFCQNNSLAVVKNERSIYGEPVEPAHLVDTALHYGSQSISYTYSEPTIYFELMLETARLATEKGLKNIMVTNGFMSAEALELISPHLDGANIDLKAFTEEFYRKQSGGRLQPVLDTIQRMKDQNIWVELTTLLIPNLNSNEEEIKKLIDFILKIDPQMPWHVSRFFPQHRMQDIPPTPPNLINKVLTTAKKAGLKYLYAGNVADDTYTHTHCPACNSLLIQRNGYSTSIQNLNQGKCSNCNHPIPGVW